MKQVIQHLGSGRTEIIEGPDPSVRAGELLISSNLSLISAGTERMLVSFARSSLLRKAAKQPERVREVLAKVKTDGLGTTIDAVRSKLGQPIALGYCNVGRVLDIGVGISGYRVGDRVISNGPHADLVRVPSNLCAKVPDGVTDEDAVFTVLASIGLQGIRLAAPTLGETFVVSGVGLIGLLTIEMLIANGCRVLAIDFDQAKLDIAAGMGATTCNLSTGEDPVALVHEVSGGIGADAVIIAASTDSDEPVKQAANMCRRRGRIVLVGVAGLKLDRADFYEKELTFQVSCSYGPGRYDPAYEDQGHDYPVGFVRWTEQRNFQAVLDLMERGSLKPSKMISGRVDFANAAAAYNDLIDGSSGLGQVIVYPEQNDVVAPRQTITLDPRAPASDPSASIGLIGGGNYASRMLIPALQNAGAELRSIASSGGLNAALNGRKFKFAEATTDAAGLIRDDAVGTIVIATQHDTHARFVIDALSQRKNVFVEKPLALTSDEVDAVEDALGTHDERPQLMVGFNRRFAPSVKRMKALLEPMRAPKSFVFLMNAGRIPQEHWTQDHARGGGRIIGEACHLIDLMRFCADSPITSVQAIGMGPNDIEETLIDKASISLRFADGSFGTVHYLANGSSSFPKERLEVFCGGGILQLDNYRKLTGFGWKGFSKQKWLKSDKGQNAMAAALMDSIATGAPAIPLDEILEVARISIEADRILREG